MKNNKGIILSTYIYILLVFFILILSTMLMVLNNTKVLSNKLKNSANTFSSKKYSFSIVLVGGDVYVAKGTAYVDKGYVAQTIGGESLTAVITSTVNMSTVGTYTYKYEVTYGAYKKSVTRTVYVIESVYYYGYTGSAQTFTVPATGYYNIELWGAQGGSNSGAEGITAGNVGGLGGYTKGIMYLEMGSTYYIFVGGKGAYATSAGLTSAKGYNGGAMAGYDSGCGTSCMKGAGAGGGATDFRLVNGTWNDSVSLNSRIMVAGGGGGAMNWNSPKAGGDGGGLFGNPGMEYNGATNPYTNAQGGTQIAGGAAGVGSVTSSPGIFGIGGDSQITYGGGGGGGYYGGGGGSVNNSVVGSGAGGSSYISGYAGVSSITSAYSTAASYTNKHYSGKYFINGQMIPAVNGDNGKAKITYFDTNMPARVGLNNVRYVKDCINGSNANASNHWVELQAIYNGDNVALNKTVTGTVAQNVSPYLYSRIVDGDITSANYAESSVSGLQCITVDLGKTYNLDEVAVWHYWADARVYNSNKTYVSSNNIDWTTAIDTGNEVETSQGKRVNAYKKKLFLFGI